MADECIGILGKDGDEIFTADAKSIVDEGVEVLIAAEGKVSLENDSIEAAQGGYNGGCELRDKGFHGVLPLTVA